MRTLFLSLLLAALTACSESDSSAQHLARAKEFINAANPAAATVELHNALQLDAESAEARWLLGNLRLEAGDILGAENELQRAQRLGWTGDDLRPTLARTLLAQGKFTEVLQLEYQELAPSAASVLLANQALAALSSGQQEEALKLATLAREKDPQTLAAKLAEATVTVHLRDAQSALQLADRILQSAPDNSEAWWIKAQALSRLGKLQDARAALDHSVALTDTSFTYRIARALINLQLQDYDAAQFDATELLALSPRNPAANYIQGVLLFQNKNYRKAITPLTLAEPVAQQFPLTLYFLGAAYLIEKDVKLAADSASRFVAIAPNDSNGRKLLAAALVQQGKSTEARSMLQPVLDNNQNDLAALNLLANALLLDDQADLGLALYARIKQIQPDWNVVPLHLETQLVTAGPGDIGSTIPETTPRTGAIDASSNFPQTDVLRILELLQEKNFEAAIAAGKSYQFRALESLAPYRLLGMIYLAAGQTENARSVLQKALKQAPGDPIANQALAQLALAENDSASARQHYQNILDVHHDDLTTMLQLSTLDASEDKTAAMVTQLSQAIAAHPDVLEPRLRLASYYLRAGSPEKVEPTFAGLIQLQREASRALEVTGMAQLAMKDNDNALLTLQRLVERTPNSADAHYLLAMAANGTGDSQQTRKQLQQAVKLNPEHVPALVGLAKLARLDGQQAAFEQYLATLVTLAPEAADVLRLRAVSSLSKGQSTAALLFAQRAFELAPSTETVLEVAALFRTVGKSALAKSRLENWLQGHPDDIAVRLSFANMLEQENAIQAAQAQYLAVLKREPGNITALNNLAWNQRLKNPKQALLTIRKAARLAPDVPELLDSLAVIESLNGEHAAAQSTMQRALAGSPQNVAMRFHDAMITAARGDKAEAIAALEKLLRQHPEAFPERAEAENLLKSLQG
ncbi:MAG: PEP-CTERM system TPR-repeat protein PrsT [Halioglobus sp.]